MNYFLYLIWFVGIFLRKWWREECRAAELRNMPYREYLKTSEWKAKARAVRQRDNYTCQNPNCRATNEELHVHHLTYERRGYERLEDLETLCWRCHAKEHGKGL